MKPRGYPTLPFNSRLRNAQVGHDMTFRYKMTTCVQDGYLGWLRKTILQDHRRYNELCYLLDYCTHYNQDIYCHWEDGMSPLATIIHEFSDNRDRLAQFYDKHNFWDHRTILGARSCLDLWRTEVL